MNQRIKELRKKLGLTMEKFGEQVGGISKSTISNIENGNRDLTDHMFKSICREFNVNEEWLRNGTGDIFIIPKDETAALVYDLLQETDSDFYNMVLDVVKTYQQLKPESRKALNEYCKLLLENTKNRKDTPDMNNSDPIRSAPSTPEELEELFPPVGDVDFKVGE